MSLFHYCAATATGVLVIIVTLATLIALFNRDQTTTSLWKKWRTDQQQTSHPCKVEIECLLKEVNYGERNYTTEELFFINDVVEECANKG